MRVQEVFFDQEQNGHRVEVIKTYDIVAAHEAFAELNDSALDFLANALKLADSYDLADIPDKTSPEYADFLWQELEDCSREDGNVCSFFVVQEVHSGNGKTVFISPDWPSAEAFAKQKCTLPPE